MPFPSDPAGQTPANTFSPTSTPDANTLNNATYTFNAADNQWSTRDPEPPTPAPPPAGTTEHCVPQVRRERPYKEAISAGGVGVKSARPK